MISKKKILVVGGDSQIGSKLTVYLRQAGESVTATTRRCETGNADRISLNLNHEIEKWTLPNSVDVAVVCAGITSLEACRKDPLGSARINIEAISALSNLLIEKGAYLLYLSTNQVFDGSTSYPLPEDPVSPITEYGKQKAEVEKRLLRFDSERVAILRITKVISSHFPLMEKWSQALKRGEVIRPFSNMFIAPVPISFLVSVLRLFIDRRLKGIFHISANDDISYAEVAHIACRIIGAKERQIQPMIAKESDLGIELVIGRTALNTDRLKAELGVMPPESQWTIEQFFKDPKVLEGITN